ncbi:thioredoxin family protein [Candidatus Sumerlaeota bacterium]|nr:thioredoxin family protein [Candidatus Sumerlaeota bacterium]
MRGRCIAIIIMTFFTVSSMAQDKGFSRFGCVFTPRVDDVNFYVYVFPEEERIEPQGKILWIRWRRSPESKFNDNITAAITLRSEKTNQLFWAKPWTEEPLTLETSWRIDRFPLFGFPRGERLASMAIGLSEADDKANYSGIGYIDVDWIRISNKNSRWDSPDAVEICHPITPPGEANRIGLMYSASFWSCEGEELIGPGWLPAKAIYKKEGSTDYVVIGVRDRHEAGKCEDTNAWCMPFYPPLNPEGSLYVRLRKDPASGGEIDFSIMIYTQGKFFEANDLNSGYSLMNWTRVPSNWTFWELPLIGTDPVVLIRIRLSDVDFAPGFVNLLTDIDFIGYGPAGLDERGFEEAVNTGKAKIFPWRDEWLEFSSQGRIAPWIIAWSSGGASFTPGYVSFISGEVGPSIGIPAPSPIPILATPSLPSPAITELKWLSFEEALRVSKEKRKPLLIYFSSRNVRLCQKLETLFTDTDIKKALSQYVLCGVEMSSENQKLFTHFRVYRVPTIIVYSSSWENKGWLCGEINKDELLKILK